MVAKLVQMNVIHHKLITMKINFFSIFALLIGCIIYAQDTKKESESIKTKMDLFSSKTGAITKFIDTNLPNIKSSYSATENRIRKISTGNVSAFFYQIVKDGQYSKSIASIEYNDLLELLKALTVLKKDVENDIVLNPDYMENKFVTVDGFEEGYYVSKGKAKWYIKLEKYGSDNTIFFDNGDIIESAFTDAKNKIDELKK